MGESRESKMRSLRGAVAIVGIGASE